MSPCLLRYIFVYKLHALLMYTRKITNIKSINITLEIMKFKFLNMNIDISG